jgi:hypothetical protein
VAGLAAAEAVAVSLQGGYSREELEAFGAVLVEALAQLVAGEAGDAATVRARVLEVVTVEEAGRVAAARLEERMGALVFASVELARGRGERGEEVGDAVRDTAQRWMAAQGPEFLFPLVAAVEQLAASRLEGGVR